MQHAISRSQVPSWQARKNFDDMALLKGNRTTLVLVYILVLNHRHCVYAELAKDSLPRDPGTGVMGAGLYHVYLIALR